MNNKNNTDKKLKIGFVFPKDVDTLSGTTTDTNYYNFTLKALPRHPDVDLTIINSTIELWHDLEKKNFDALLFIFLKGDRGFPYGLDNLNQINTTKILFCGDAHDALYHSHFYNMKLRDLILNFGFDALFHEHDNFYAEKFFPKEKFNYWHIPLGFEKEVYKNISDFKPRIKNKILCTGAYGGVEHYNLRRTCIKKCKKVYYCGWTKRKNNIGNNIYIGDNYVKLLEQFQASIAATTTVATNKYLEIPAAGCLTFMEVTEQNHADLLGFKDGVNAIFINEENYKQKFDEYLKDPDNPKWEQIAKAGREFVMNNYTTDHCVDKLIQKIKQFIKDNPREKQEIKYPKFPGENCVKTFVLSLKRSTDRQKIIKQNLKK